MGNSDFRCIIQVHISSVGAAIMRLSVPDKRGHAADVVLGYDTASTYAVSVAVLTIICAIVLGSGA